ncbi:MAG: hypothetical protein EOM44_08895 [Bacteroidia bacterium]|nr:hypothetical protein [Bacteroidia bacterium]
MNHQVKICLVLFVIFLSILSCFGENELTTYKTLKDNALKSNDTTKIIVAYNELGDYYSESGEYKKGDSLLNISLRLAVARKDYDMCGKINNLLASNASYQGDRALAFKYYNNALEQYAKTKDMDGMALILMNMGSEYEYAGDLSKAMEHKLKALKYKEASGEKKNLDYYYQSVGQLFKETNVKKWEYYVQKAYLVSKKLPEKRIQTQAAIFNDLAGIAESKKEFKESLIWYDSMIIISEKAGYINGLSTALSNRAMVYKSLKRFEDALNDVTKAMEFDKKMNRNYSRIVNKTHAGQILMELNRFSEAKKHLTEALDIAKSLKAYPEEEAVLHNSLARIGEKTGDWKSAFKHYLDYKNGMDSIRNAETENTIHDLEIKYQTSEKEKKIAELNNDIELKNLQINRNKYIIFSLTIFSLLVILLFLYLNTRNRLRQQMKQAELQQKLLRSQLNPHFIFNAIGSIQSYMYRNDAKNASSYLTRFALLMRAILEQSSEDQIPLSEEVKMLENYLSLEKLRKNDAFQYRITVDNDIDTDETVLPSMLIQPFAENAIKHAFQTDSEENMLSISFSKSGNTLHIEVADNGIGINQTAQQEKNHQSMASEIFEQRMKILGRKWKNKTYFSVHDLSESGSRGTRVVFGIPLF